ncbi:hypothetical protein [Anatilimnocola floriformis]|uniref:hypothetical protein n=1 Tax=Anatilimnocola floriformis TaxID=2948575 RepID=UPI0020C26C74|nr:hypothetical protein [Anatilimnocola floriformis]
MTTLLDQTGYEQTKSKLHQLDARLAVIQQRTDLNAEHLHRVVASYQAMKKQYLEEIRLFEATRAKS